MRTAWNKIEWTEFEEKLIRKYWQEKTVKQLHILLGKPISFTSLRQKLYEMGLYKMHMEYWTDDMENWLKNNFRKYGDTEIAEIFNKKFPKEKKWTKKHINKKRFHLKLKRTDNNIQKIRERVNSKGIYTRASKKRWETIGERKMYSVVRWGKLEWIKTPDGYKLKNRYMYEQQYGSIPAGMIVKEINGKLKLITREENALINSNSKREKSELKIAIMTTKDEYNRKYLFATKVLNYSSVAGAIEELSLIEFNKQLKKYIS